MEQEILEITFVFRINYITEIRQGKKTVKINMLWPGEYVTAAPATRSTCRTNRHIVNLFRFSQYSKRKPVDEEQIGQRLTLASLRDRAAELSDVPENYQKLLQEGIRAAERKLSGTAVPSLPPVAITEQDTTTSTGSNKIDFSIGASKDLGKPSESVASESQIVTRGMVAKRVEEFDTLPGWSPPSTPSSPTTTPFVPLSVSTPFSGPSAQELGARSSNRKR